MLVLTRKEGGKIMIGNDIVITVVDIGRDRVRIGIEAPTDVSVHRSEVYESIHQEKSRRSPTETERKQK